MDQNIGSLVWNVKLDTTQLESQLRSAEQKMTSQAKTIKLNLDNSEALKKIEAIVESAKKLSAPIKLNLDTSEAQQKIKALAADLKQQFNSALNLSGSAVGGQTPSGISSGSRNNTLIQSQNVAQLNTTPVSPTSMVTMAQMQTTTLSGGASGIGMMGAAGAMGMSGSSSIGAMAMAMAMGVKPNPTNPSGGSSPSTSLSSSVNIPTNITGSAPSGLVPITGNQIAPNPFVPTSTNPYIPNMTLNTPNFTPYGVMPGTIQGGTKFDRRNLTFTPEEIVGKEIANRPEPYQVAMPSASYTKILPSDFGRQGNFPLFNDAMSGLNRMWNGSYGQSGGLIGPPEATAGISGRLNDIFNSDIGNPRSAKSIYRNLGMPLMILGGITEGISAVGREASGYSNYQAQIYHAGMLGQSTNNIELQRTEANVEALKGNYNPFDILNGGLWTKLAGMSLTQKGLNPFGGQSALGAAEEWRDIQLNQQRIGKFGSPKQGPGDIGIENARNLQSSGLDVSISGTRSSFQRTIYNIDKQKNEREQAIIDRRNEMINESSQLSDATARRNATTNAQNWANQAFKNNAIISENDKKNASLDIIQSTNLMNIGTQYQTGLNTQVNPQYLAIQGMQMAGMSHQAEQAGFNAQITGLSLQGQKIYNEAKENVKNFGNSAEDQSKAAAIWNQATAQINSLSGQVDIIKGNKKLNQLDYGYSLQDINNNAAVINTRANGNQFGASYQAIKNRQAMADQRDSSPEGKSAHAAEANAQINAITKDFQISLQMLSSEAKATAYALQGAGHAYQASAQNIINERDIFNTQHAGEPEVIKLNNARAANQLKLIAQNEVDRRNAIDLSTTELEHANSVARIGLKDSDKAKEQEILLGEKDAETALNEDRTLTDKEKARRRIAIQDRGNISLQQLENEKGQRRATQESSFMSPFDFAKNVGNKIGGGNNGNMGLNNQNAAEVAGDIEGQENANHQQNVGILIPLLQQIVTNTAKQFVAQ